MEITVYEAMAKLTLSESERPVCEKRAGELLAAFDGLTDIDTSGLEPLISVLDVKSVLREDAAEKFIERGELLANAPEQHDGYFQVPKILE